MTPKTHRRESEADVERMLESYFRATRPRRRDEESPRGPGGRASLPSRAGRKRRSRAGRGKARAHARRALVRRVPSPLHGGAPWALQLCRRGSRRLAYAAGEATLATGSLVCLAGAAIAACGIPDMVSSRSSGMIELERSCLHSAGEVTAARCAVLAFSNALALACVTLATANALSEDAVGVMLHAIAPYLLTVGGACSSRERPRAQPPRSWRPPGAALITFGSYEGGRAPAERVRADVGMALGAHRPRRATALVRGQLRAWLREVTASRTSSPASPSFQLDEGGHAAGNEGNHDSGNRPSDETIRRESGRMDDVSTTLAPGVYGLLGANGAGKTTLMRMICDVLRSDEGTSASTGRAPGLWRALPRPARLPPPGLRLLSRLHRHGLHALHGGAQDSGNGGPRCLELLDQVGLSDVTRQDPRSRAA